mmetsp:Transcript_75478/g.157426  ORF Transcript_75478/g.157426 Transcript_75478/m.157426 type:complete len:231 (-) Transcript_75478:126-818(-)
MHSAARMTSGAEGMPSICFSMGLVQSRTAAAAKPWAMATAPGSAEVVPEAASEAGAATPALRSRFLARTPVTTAAVSVSSTSAAAATEAARPTSPQPAPSSKTIGQLLGLAVWATVKLWRRELSASASCLTRTVAPGQTRANPVAEASEKPSSKSQVPSSFAASSPSSSSSSSARPSLCSPRAGARLLWATSNLTPQMVASVRPPLLFIMFVEDSAGSWTPAMAAVSLMG